MQRVLLPGALMQIEKKLRTVLLVLLLVAVGATLGWGHYDPIKGIQVVTATFGENCKAPVGNITRMIGAVCNGHGKCAFQVNPTIIRFDPAPGCDKDLKVSYVCPPLPAERTLASGPGVGLQPDIYEISCDD
jgi:hypothetical protein